MFKGVCSSFFGYDIVYILAFAGVISCVVMFKVLFLVNLNVEIFVFVVVVVVEFNCMLMFVINVLYVLFVSV